MHWGGRTSFFINTYVKNLDNVRIIWYIAVMAITATRLRQNLYRILDDVLEKGVPVEIERKGEKLKIVPEKPVSKWDRLEAHDAINGDPEDIVHIDWSGEWMKNTDVL